MIECIASKDDVEAFLKLLIAEGVSFHPDDDFNDYYIPRRISPVIRRMKTK